MKFQMTKNKNTIHTPRSLHGDLVRSLVVIPDPLPYGLGSIWLVVSGGTGVTTRRDTGRVFHTGRYLAQRETNWLYSDPRLICAVLGLSFEVVGFAGGLWTSWA